MLKSQKDASGAFFMSNNYEEAEAQIQKAIRLNPDDLELRLADAKFRAMSGRKLTSRKLVNLATTPKELPTQKRCLHSSDTTKPVSKCKW